MSKTGKRALLLLALALAAIVAFIVISESNSRRREEAYRQAQALYQEGKFEQAAAIYTELKDEAWLRNCEQGIAERDARALYDAGKPEEALSLLRERAPGSPLRAALAEERAAALMDAGNYGEALAVLRRDAPESASLPLCEQMAEQTGEEQTFRTLAARGNWDEAGESLSKIETMNAETQRLSKQALEALRLIVTGDFGRWCVAEGLARPGGDAYVLGTLAEVMAAHGHYSNALGDYKAAGDEEGMRSMLAAMKDKGSRGRALFMAYEALGDEEGMRSEAEWMLSSGEYARAYEAYETLKDEDGKRAVIGAQAAAGQIVQALKNLIAVGDYEQASALLDRIPAEGSLISGTGPGIVCADELSSLLEQSDGPAAALASGLVGTVVAECRGQIAKGLRCVPYYALCEVKSRAESLWTDEMEALRAGCPQEFPAASGILRESWAAKAEAGGGQAAITVHNGKKAAVLHLRQMKTPDPLSDISIPTENFISVFIRPNDIWTFRVPAGYYSASVTMGDEWFGDRENFGLRVSSSDVRIGVNPYKPQQGQRLEGSYSLTLK